MAARHPTISDLTDRDCVLRAIEEFNHLGRDNFLEKYKYRRARRLRARHRGKLYDSKAIAGVAWALQHFDDGHKRPHAYTGGARTAVPALRKLKFEVVGTEAALCLVSNRPIQERRLRLLDSLGIGHVYIENGEVHVSGTSSSRAIFPRSD